MQERLHKLIAHAGIASRRKAEELIRQGRVTVNGQKVTTLGSKADPDSDHIKVDGRRLQPQKPAYYAVNKPVGVLSSASDSKGRRVVTDLVPGGQRLYPAGRLDFNSEGLMIVTNDGELTRRLTQAGGFEKVYRVKVRGRPSDAALKKMREGLRLDGEQLAPCRVRLLKAGANCWFRVGLKQGRNRQIRRMFESVGNPVMRLRRISIGPVQLGRLRPGHYRRLSRQELEGLEVDRSRGG